MPNIAISVEQSVYDGFQRVMRREEEQTVTHVMRKLAKAYASGWITFQGPYPFVDPGEIQDARIAARMEERGDPEPAPTPLPKVLNAPAPIVLRHGMLLSEITPKEGECLSQEWMDAFSQVQQDEARYDAQLGKWLPIKEKK